MSDRGFDKAGLARVHEVLEGHTAGGGVVGLSWALARGGEVEVGASGTTAEAGGVPAGRDTIFRIASMTKPVTAVAALILVEECKLRLEDPVDELLPELANRQVLVKPEGPIDDTVPAVRPVTLHDLLTFRFGIGMDFTRWDQQPVLNALGDLGLGAGPPSPQGPPPPDEWLARLGTVPLERQPGERWLYHVGADVAGVLVARAAGQPLEAFLRARIFEPLGMKDTAFSVPAADLGRFGPSYTANMETGVREVYDATDDQWAAPPAFPSGGGGLVSTVDDYLAFADMLRKGGTSRDGERILSRPSVEAMTTNHLTDAQIAASGPSFNGSTGWGFGVGVTVRRTGVSRTVGSYGWDGGLGTSWANDPTEDLVGILLTNQSFTSPQPPPVVSDFWTSAYAALD
jgi:CubicO group peptidase (beta-lactamase class C family)